MRKLFVVGLALVAAVACGDSAELAAVLLSDAGEVLQDAARVLDAGSDAAEAQDADAHTATGREVREVPCSFTRDVTPVGNVAAGYETDEHWAALEVDQEAVRHVWLCDPAKQVDTCAAGCEGDTIPEPECTSSTANYAGGNLWVFCGRGKAHWQKARVVLE